ncbi:MAG: hypothetical protein GF320_01795 [Armatimonadia bacterium]|nr:hypothetical protein [Armatimonadia bacterium]
MAGPVRPRAKTELWIGAGVLLLLVLVLGGYVGLRSLAALAWASAYSDPPGTEREPDRTDPNEILPSAAEMEAVLRDADDATPSQAGNSTAEWVPSEGRAVPSITLSDGIQGGIHLVDAWLEPPEAGCVWVEIRHAELGHRLSVWKTVGRTHIVVPARSESGQVLHFETEAMVDEGNWEYTYPALFQIWFRPASGGPDQLLVETQKETHGWMR